MYHRDRLFTAAHQMLCSAWAFYHFLITNMNVLHGYPAIFLKNCLIRLCITAPRHTAPAVNSIVFAKAAHVEICNSKVVINPGRPVPVPVLDSP